MWMAIVIPVVSMGQNNLIYAGTETVETGAAVQGENGPQKEGLWTQCPERFEEGAVHVVTDVELRQDRIRQYVQTVSALPAYLRAENAEQVFGLLEQAEGIYQSLSENERLEPEVIAAKDAWSSMVEQSQNTALTAGNVTINYVSPSGLGEIENLVPRQGSTGPESEYASLDEQNSAAANGTIAADVIHDQGTGGNQEMFSLFCEGEPLEAGAKLTVRYVNIGTYYEGRIYTNQNVQGITVNAIVTISNPYNANRLSLYENFWMGGTVNGGSGKLGYSPGTPGRADVSITFCDQSWNVIRLKEDAQLIASSISHGYYKGCSYEGISFSGAGADTTVRIYSQSYGNIGIDNGNLFGLGQTFYGERADSVYCADEGGPHSGGYVYVDTRQSTTFMVHGVGFYQNADTWQLTMTTQTVYNGGHDYWFYFTAAPANMARPEAPVKRVSRTEVPTGETLEYTLEQRLSTVQEDGYGYYGSLIFYDILPSEVEYLSAGMYLDGVDVTGEAGTLSYHSPSGKVTYTFFTSYLKNMEYQGQVAKLVIACRLRAGIESAGPIVNEGHVSVCGRVESSTAAFTPLFKVTTEIVNGIIDPSITGIYPGESRTISYRPLTGYTVETVTVDGGVVEQEMDASSHLFCDIASDHHIRVVCQKIQPDRLIRITKRILAEEIIFDHGMPTFLFCLEGEDIAQLNGSSRFFFSHIGGSAVYLLELEP